MPWSLLVHDLRDTELLYMRYGSGCVPDDCTVVDICTCLEERGDCCNGAGLRRTIEWSGSVGVCGADISPCKDELECALGSAELRSKVVSGGA